MAKRIHHKSGSKRTGARRSSVARKPSSIKNHKLPKDGVTPIVILRAKDGQDPLLEAELRALVGPTRREAGCLTYDLHRGAEGGGWYLLHEVWESREHHRVHTQTPHFIRWNARKDGLLASRDATFWKQVV